MVDEKNTSTTTYLSAANLDSGNVTTIMPLGTDEFWRILGAVDNRLILIKTYGVKEIIAGEGESADMHYEAWEVDLTAPQLDTCVKEWTYSEMDAIMFDNYLYGYNKQERTFSKTDMSTGATQTVSYGEDFLNPYAVFLYAGQIDGKLMAEVTDGEETYTRYLIDFDNSDIKPLTLTTTGIKEQPLPILGAYQDYLYVLTGYQETSYIDIGPDGSPFEATSYENREALISKVDFLANQANYLPIQNATTS